MSVFSYNIMIFRLLGMWYPEDNNSAWKKIFYIFYTTLIVSIYYTNAISQIIILFGSLDDAKEFSGASFITITRILVCYKMYNILSKRKYIIHIINTLETGSFKARDSVELSIQTKFSRKIKLLIITYGALCATTLTALLYVSILVDIPQRKLAFEAWLPVNTSIPIFYWIVFIYQHFSGYCGTSISVSFDTVLVGSMILLCAQLNILKYRLRHGHNNNEIENKSEKKYLIDCIEHHKAIYELAELSNEAFSNAIFLQYFASLIVLCVSSFQLSQEKPFTKKFNDLILYLICQLLQVFMFCYWATQVQVESENIITGVYDCEWLSLSITTKKNLILTMVRALKPIQYSSGYVVNLSLTEFTNLLRMSYSIYSILQQSNSRTR
ncbi:odorant receptor Or1-like [Aphidius gifuensis]|uniref:odorant receptor Or1-like n=1 Tax=Aphidius gifuensis TaxID=684658 RepID=UPI001CDBF72B|nr:odorant receptor Or1-like [Aphidius gifuensis]